MKSIEQITANARPERPFSNGTEWSIWANQWCYRCRNDEWGLGPEGTECPLIAAAVCHQVTPLEWLQVGLGDYTCIEFRGEDDGDPEPAPEPIPGQGELFDPTPYAGPRVFADVAAEASRSLEEAAR